MSLLLFDSYEAPAVVPPPAPVAIPFVEPFADMVADVDRLVLSALGGTPVIYQPAVGAALQVSGVFDEMYLLVKGDPEAGVETLVPAVFLRLEDLPVDPELDEPILTIGGVEYRVRERQPAGLGAIVLALRRTT